MRTRALLLLTLLPTLAVGEDRPLLNGELSALAFGMAWEEAHELIGAACGEVRRVDVDPPSFPRA